VAVGSDTQAFANISYMLSDNIALELLAATPFEHKISATGSLLGEIATVKQLPPALSLQYHFLPNKSISPYFGADFEMSKDWFANLDLRYINIDTTATTNLGTVDVTIAPWVFSAGVGFKF